MQPDNIRQFNAMERYSRGQDPIETNGKNFDDRELAQHAVSDISRIDQILNSDISLDAQERHELYLMGCNRRLEWLYAKNGGKTASLSEFTSEISRSNEFFVRAGKDASATADQHPERVWDIRLKHLDLVALLAHRNAHDSQTTLRGTPQEGAAWTTAENQMYTLLRKSINFMYDIAQSTQGRDWLAQKARGTLNEVLLITYKRLKTYEDQTFGDTFVRSALDREDEPWNRYAYPKRAVDIIIEEKNRRRLIQAKNYDNRDEYAHPIEKIVDSDYGTTRDKLDLYIADMRIVIENPSDSRMQARLDASAKRLDAVFGAKLGELQTTGR